VNAPFTESVVEDAALARLEALGYAVLHGSELAAGRPAAERTDPGKPRQHIGLRGIGAR
jgi:type I restriction enzyme, R subunit